MAAEEDLEDAFKTVYVSSNGRELSEAELTEYKEMFSLVDKDGGGTICKEELADLMALLNIKKTPEELDADMAEIDADGNGEVDFDEFVGVMSKSVNTSYTADKVREAFRTFQDPKYQGYIRPDQLLQALTHYGVVPSTMAEAKELISVMDVDPNGLIHFDEYIRMMMND